MQNKSRNYWPHAIIASLILIVVSCIYTIVVALKHPVEMDSFYFQSYQEVDKNYDKIEASQKAFDKKYNIVFEINGIDANAIYLAAGNNVKIIIKDKEKDRCSFNADMKLLLTRPETNKYNQNPKISNYDSDKCEWLFEPIFIDKVGRWQIQAKITIGEDIGFFTRELNVLDLTSKRDNL